MSETSTALDSSETSPIFTSEQLLLFAPDRVPRHIALMMDGNRRWAKQRGLPIAIGHWEGAETLDEATRAAAELGVETLTCYSFSTENWTRPEAEIEALMHLFEVYLVKKRDAMIKEGIRLDAIGDLAQLPARVQKAFYQTKKATERCNRINLILALNYGGRDEIRRAIVKILQQSKEGKIRPEDLTEELISQCLDTTPWGDPDLVIRTSGELRISNFLLWQASYAEFYVTDVLWPDFSAKELLEAILVYQSRGRRWGGL